jgi:transposase
MIQITPQMRILLAVQPVDFRKGIDGLASVCRSVIGAAPLSGYLFVFRNRRKTAIKALTYDGQGYWLWYLCEASHKYQRQKPFRSQ